MRCHARTGSTLLFHDQLPGKDGVDVLMCVRRNVAARPAVLLCSSERSDFPQNRVGKLRVRVVLLKRLSAHDLTGSLPASTAVFRPGSLLFLKSRRSVSQARRSGHSPVEEPGSSHDTLF